MNLPRLDPEECLAGWWREAHPSESVLPTIAEYGLLAGLSEGEARRWLLRCAAANRAAVRRRALHHRRVAGIADHELDAAQEVLDWAVAELEEREP